MMEEKKDLCILTLLSFQHEDVGTYKAIFLAKISDTKVLEVVALARGMTSGEIFGVLLLAALLISMIAGAIFFFWRYLWSGRKGGKEARDKKDQEIMAAIREEKFDKLTETIGNRKLQRVKDTEGNTIFHLVASNNWPNKMTPVVLEQLRKNSKRFQKCLQKNVEAQDLEENNPLDISRKDEIFKIKLMNWKDVLPSWFPSENLSLIEKQIIDLNTQNKKGQTALHIACEEGAESVVQTLLYLHVKTDLVDQEDLDMENPSKYKQNNSPLHKAVLENHLNIVKLILNHDASLKKCLLKQERNGTKTDGAGRKVLVTETAVELAARLGHLPIARFIIEEVEDDSWREREIALVYIAISTSNNNLLVCLEEKGVKYKTTSVFHDGEELLQRSVFEENIEAIKKLITLKLQLNEIKKQIWNCENNKVNCNILKLLQEYEKKIQLSS